MFLFKQAKDRWGNNLRGPYFNISAGLYVGSTTAGTDSNTTAENASGGNDITIDAGNSTTDYSVPDVEASSVTFLNNSSGVAVVTYMPVDARPSFLYGDLACLPSCGPVSECVEVS